LLDEVDDGMGIAAQRQAYARGLQDLRRADAVTEIPFGGGAEASGRAAEAMNVVGREVGGVDRGELRPDQSMAGQAFHRSPAVGRFARLIFGDLFRYVRVNRPVEAEVGQRIGRDRAYRMDGSADQRVRLRLQCRDASRPAAQRAVAETELRSGQRLAV